MKKIPTIVLAMVFALSVGAFAQQKDIKTKPQPAPALTRSQVQPKENKSLDQLKAVEKSSQSAKRDANRGNYEGAKEKSGRGFDTPQPSTGTVRGQASYSDPKTISDRENKANQQRERERSRRYRLDDPRRAPPSPKI